MSDIAIRVENLSKLYRIGRREGDKTLRDILADAMYAAFRAAASALGGRRETIGPRSADDQIWALKDVSFEIQRGEVVGIIGPNGAGKTTLLKILSRITEPTEGYAEIRGRVGSLLEVGTGFHPELTGRENIYLNGAILGMKKVEIERKFDEIVAFAEVEKFIDTPVKHYSSGMYVRLAFAVAAHLEPEILLVDEVLAVGDAAFQKKCLGKMEDISGQGRTILFVSHNMPSIEALCQRAFLLKNGKVVLSGAPEVVINHYLNRKVSPTAGLCDLSDHPHRITPADTAMFKSIRLLNGEGNATSTFQMGETIVFEIVLDTGGRVLNTPLIAIWIERRGVRICHLSTRYMVKDSFELSGKVLLRCYWDPGWLAPGVYSVSRLGIKNHAGGKHLDNVEEVISFEIVARDVYGTGMVATDAPVLVPNGRWEYTVLAS